MAQPQSNDMASAEASPGSPPPFLDENFKAIRLMVYDILKALPPNDSDRPDYDTVATWEQGEWDIFQEFSVTRKSLRLTCKKIKDEWTGQFLRSTTICLDTMRTIARFRTELLTSLSEDEIKYIGRFSYNGSRRGMFTPIIRCPNLLLPDARGLEELASLLRGEPLLQLETLDVKFGGDEPRLLWRRNEESKSQIESRLHPWLSQFNLRDFENEMTATALKDSSVVRLFEGIAVQYFFRRKKPAVTDEIYGQGYDDGDDDSSDGDDSVTTMDPSDDDDDDVSEDGTALDEERGWDSEEEGSKEGNSDIGEDTASNHQESDSGTGVVEKTSNGSASKAELAMDETNDKRKRVFAEVEE
ncbi:hypothetical protein H2200_008880 [Cladophialophora chaetospira]|uniref:Uncharacterized protein n=1 Tax=Cladophialophora chaetospira TaxID=386627 RepID=A0AA38X4Y8_9EURO|nr:hypothetical protein H2200_008880 [Cladophialophora chaetospira]